MNILGLAIVKQRKYLLMEAELVRLKEIESRYIRLTDRDAKGRFVKNER